MHAGIIETFVLCYGCCYDEYQKRRVTTSYNQDQEDQHHTENDLEAQEREARLQAVRENAKGVFRDSGLAEMLKGINRNLLKGRGRFEEYDSMVLLRWGTSSTMRHIWAEVEGNTLRFRLLPHRKCTAPAPICDGEYHIFTSVMWSNRAFLQAELKKYYDRPVAETSSH